MAAGTLDLVTHDDARPGSPAVCLDGGAALTYGELAGLTGEFERVLRHDEKALVLCAGDRDLPTVAAYLAALRLGHAVAFLPASAEILSAYQPEFVVPAPGQEARLADPGYSPAAETAAGTAIFRRASRRPAGEIYTGTITIGPAPLHARAVPGEGAVRYRGPGVMLGYAAGRADLRRGAEVDVLDTGDLGYLRDGYLYLTGRTKRIVKVLGVRTSLDDPAGTSSSCPSASSPALPAARSTTRP